MIDIATDQAEQVKDEHVRNLRKYRPDRQASVGVEEIMKEIRRRIDDHDVSLLRWTEPVGGDVLLSESLGPLRFPIEFAGPVSGDLNVEVDVSEGISISGSVGSVFLHSGARLRSFRLAESGEIRGDFDVWDRAEVSEDVTIDGIVHGSVAILETASIRGRLLVSVSGSIGGTLECSPEAVGHDQRELRGKVGASLD
jgi:hypothetical protein